METNELTRIYPIAPNTMWKHCVYEVQVEPMSCRRENSYKPLHCKFIRKQLPDTTNELLKRVPLTTINALNDSRLSMGVVDVSMKRIMVSTNMHEVYERQTFLFEQEYGSCVPAVRSHADSVHRDIRIRFADNELKQQFRELSYNESHFYIGLERNGSLPKTYDGKQWDRLIVGNMRNHRTTFIGLCLFKSMH